MTRLELAGGKYVVLHDNGVGFRAERNGEPWRDLCGDKLVFSMAQEIERLREVASEVHSWAVCACLTTPDDMAQNFPRIVEITAPEEGNDHG